MPAYEVSWKDEENAIPERKSRSSHKIASGSWRYWVITSDGISADTQDLQLAVNLLQNDLDLGFEFLHLKDEKGTTGFRKGSGNSSFFESCWPYPMIGDGSLKITTEEISTAGRFFNAIKTCQTEQPQIYQALWEFSQLKALPRLSNIIVLGYFSIIEALVTHDPKKDFDSLNHQISTKMTLLSKRFERPLDYDGQFGETEWEKAWKKLYAYRSALAHGSTVDFKNELKVLKDQATALNFLKEATKLTLLFAMREPELLADLKRC